MLRPLFATTHNASPSALHRMLDLNLQLAPAHRDQLINHLPMALHALSDLGATPERLQAFFKRYLVDHAVAHAAVPVAVPADWLALRGQTDAFAQLRAYFEQALDREGADALLHRALPDLLGGVASAAFHCVIRLAHAVQAGHPGELASALAYWAGRWRILPPPRSRGTSPADASAAAPVLLSFDAWSSKLMDGTRAWHSNEPSITAQMEAASHSPLYQELAGALAPLETTRDRVAELAGMALKMYLGSGNFTALHMITGMRALRVLLPWIKDQDPAQVVFAHAIAAACLASQVPGPSQQVTCRRADWSSVIQTATKSDNAHVIKLVHACREEEEAYGTAAYLDAAALSLGWTVTPAQ